jgi:hypothetical protein
VKPLAVATLGEEESNTVGCGYQRLLKRAVFEQDFLLFVILGRQSIRLWEERRVSTRSTVLKPCPEIVDSVRLTNFSDCKSFGRRPI